MKRQKGKKTKNKKIVLYCELRAVLHPCDVFSRGLCTICFPARVKLQGSFYKYLTQSIFNLAQLACEWLYHVSYCLIIAHLHSHAIQPTLTIRKSWRKKKNKFLGPFKGRGRGGGTLCKLVLFELRTFFVIAVDTVIHGFSLWLGPQLASPRARAKARAKYMNPTPRTNQHPFTCTGLVLKNQCSRYWNTICSCMGC